MNDLISKTGALALIKSMMETYWDCKQILSIVRNGIEKLPSAEPKKGRWYIVDEPVKGNGLYECSECYGVEDEQTEFCPYCGAKMEVTE